MKDVLKAELLLIEERYILLDNLIISSEEECSYELEYEYLRGKRDMLLHLLSLCEE